MMKVIITGASGMVGEGVLLECLANAEVSEVLIVGRRPSGHQHAKLREVLHQNFLDLQPIEKQLEGFDACFFCLGISSVGISAEDYKRMTYDLTLEMGKRLARISPEITFCYVTGLGTDSSEKGRTRWARVKGATENELLKILKNAYMFRPGAMSAVSGQKNLKLMYKIFAPLLPAIKLFAPNFVCSLEEVGRAMIACARTQPPLHKIEVADIKRLATRVGTR